MDCYDCLWHYIAVIAVLSTIQIIFEFFLLKNLPHSLDTHVRQFSGNFFQSPSFFGCHSNPDRLLVHSFGTLLVTEARVYEQLAESGYVKVQWPGVELATS